MPVTRFSPENRFGDEELVTLFHALELAANADTREREDAIEEWQREVSLELVVRGVFAW